MFETLILSIQTAFYLNPFAQILGVIALGLSIYNFTFCKNNKFILFTAISSVFWGFHFLGLGLLAAAYINFIDIVKNLISLKYQKNLIWMGGFSFLYILIGIYTYEGSLISIIPTLTSIISTYLVFYVRGIWLNICFLGVVCLWIMYNYVGHSIGGLATDIFIMGFGIIGIIRQLSETKSH